MSDYIVPIAMLMLNFCAGAYIVYRIMKPKIESLEKKLELCRLGERYSLDRYNTMHESYERLRHKMESEL